MLTLDLVEIDTTDWNPHQRTPTDRGWSVGGDGFRFLLIDKPCFEDTVEGWQRRAERETTAGGGTWLSFDEVSIDGCVAFQGIFKYPAAKVIPDFPPDAATCISDSTSRRSSAVPPVYARPPSRLRNPARPASRARSQAWRSSSTAHVRASGAAAVRRP